ncbi:hypothetical protein C1645_880240 [Glomus cerebriforme]|uniref:C2H2-type domain-containing protein n=1 Tax=Glomus cerebriforme TaxID=658196 RepID=A0A397SGS8_9GLOM|nr:hypothetical protein C1645_880240 [Glomus cerebriforme]
MTFKCLHCSQTFATSYALNDIFLTGLWADLPIDDPDLWDDDLPTEDQIQNEDIELMIIEQDVEILIEKDWKSEKGDETDEKIDNDLTFPLSIDSEDFYGTTLADAITDKMHLPNTEWPNDIYREFIEIVMEYQLSNSCGDRIIKLINNSPNSTIKIYYQTAPRKVVNSLMLTNFLI